MDAGVFYFEFQLKSGMQEHGKQYVDTLACCSLSASRFQSTALRPELKIQTMRLPEQRENRDRKLLAIGLYIDQAFPAFLRNIEACSAILGGYMSLLAEEGCDIGFKHGLGILGDGVQAFDATLDEQCLLAFIRQAQAAIFCIGDIFQPGQAFGIPCHAGRWPSLLVTRNYLIQRVKLICC